MCGRSTRLAVGGHRADPAEAVPVLGNGREEPALRQPAGHRRRTVARAGGRAGPRLRRGDARRAGLTDRAGRHERVRRSASAPSDRPGPRPPSADLPVRRLVLRARPRPTPGCGPRWRPRYRRDHVHRGPAGPHDRARGPNRRPRRRPGRGTGTHAELMESSETYREIVLSRLERSRRPQRERGSRNEERATPARGPGPAAGERGGPGRFMSGMSTEKALDFKGPGRRLLGLAQAVPPAGPDPGADPRGRQRDAVRARAPAARRGDQPRLRRLRVAPRGGLRPRGADRRCRGRAQRRLLGLRAVPGQADRDHGRAVGVPAARAGAGQAVPAGR